MEQVKVEDAVVVKIHYKGKTYGLCFEIDGETLTRNETRMGFLQRATETGLWALGLIPTPLSIANARLFPSREGLTQEERLDLYRETCLASMQPVSDENAKPSLKLMQEGNHASARQS